MTLQIEHIINPIDLKYSELSEDYLIERAKRSMIEQLVERLIADGFVKFEKIQRDSDAFGKMTLVRMTASIFNPNDPIS